MIDGNGAVEYIAAPSDPGNADVSTMLIDGAANLDVENLEIRGALYGQSYTDINGLAKTYDHKARSIHLHTTTDVTVRNCLLDFSSEAINSNADNTDTVVEGNYIVNLGTDADPDHKAAGTYMEGVGTTYRFNHYGDFNCTSCNDGPALKDRSVNTQIYGNYFNSNASWDIDLVESIDPNEDAAHGFPEGTGSANVDTWVFGNVFVKPSSVPTDDPSRRFVFFGGDFYECTAGDGNSCGTAGCTPGQDCEPDDSWFRKRLEFYNNTIVAKGRTDSSYVVEVKGSGSTIHSTNNLIYSDTLPAVGKALWEVNTETNYPSATTAYLKRNLLNTDTTRYLDKDPTNSSVTIAASDESRSDAPAFANITSNDYHLTSASPARDTGVLVSTSWPQPFTQYDSTAAAEGNSETRLFDCRIDIGAYEYSGGRVCGVYGMTSQGDTVIEAEHYHGRQNLSPASYSPWTLGTWSGNEGDGALQVGAGSSVTQSYSADAMPGVDYQVLLPKQNLGVTNYVWVRGLIPSLLTGANRVHVGLDDNTFTYGNDLIFQPVSRTTVWQWNVERLNDSAHPVQFSGIPSTNSLIATISLWMDRSNFIADKILVTRATPGPGPTPAPPSDANGAESLTFPFLDDDTSDHVLAIYASHYVSNEGTATGADHNWRGRTVSGIPGMYAQPANGTVWALGSESTSPALEFHVRFQTAGTHYVWLLGSGNAFGTSNALYGLNRIQAGLIGPISSLSRNWCGTYAGGAATVNVPAPGDYMLCSASGWRAMAFALTKSF